MKFKFRDIVKVNDPFYGDHIGFIVNKRETEYHSPNSSNRKVEYLVMFNVGDERHWLQEDIIIKVD